MVASSEYRANGQQKQTNVSLLGQTCALNIGNLDFVSPGPGGNGGGEGERSGITSGSRFQVHCKRK